MKTFHKKIFNYEPYLSDSDKAAALKKVEELETGNALLLEQTEELSSHLEDLDSLVEELTEEAEDLGADITSEELKDSYSPELSEEEKTSLEAGGAVTTPLNVDSTGQQIEQTTPNINPFN